ncbi:hypothetical protein [Enhygromyxa salina]|uniref:hypothetical protein n=1 Tax=Enhygromyxa salina TaxID=215803 RepID=UPI0013FD0151|nr:hypothetical protein [Enhygromyxa salina]
MPTRNDVTDVAAGSATVTEATVTEASGSCLGAAGGNTGEHAEATPNSRTRRVR